MPSRILGPRMLGAVICTVVLASSSVHAQHFGRNKVQYDTFTFQILKTEHFDIYYYPEAREGVEIAARMAERWRVRLGSMLDHELRGRQPLVLYASHVHFQQTNTIPGDLGEGTGGVTEPLRRRIVLPLAGPLADTDHVLGHELVHAFQFDITTRENAPPGVTGAGRLPLWFIEGMAEYLSLGSVDPNTAMWLRDAVQNNRLPQIRDLDNPKYFPYRWGQAFWAYVGGRWGDQTVRQMLDAASRAGDPRHAIEEVLGVDEKTLSSDWHAAIRSAYQPVLEGRSEPESVGTALFRDERRRGDVNIAPAISPDGRLMAFLSERSLFSIDLYVADTATGKILHKLTSTASDPHYSSIQFISSSGAWDADSRRLAIATVTSGKPALAIFDARSGRRQLEIPIQEVDEVFNPTWSPDGRSICFTGMRRGLMDLFIVDVATAGVKPITNDAFADFQPAWSPDGRRIAFVTDRFTSQLATIEMGGYRIGFIDPATGDISAAPGFGDGKVINPQWGPNGQSLYFIAEDFGIPNVYRMELPSGVRSAVTAVGTGISGITRTSPAMSVSNQTGTVAVCVYDEGRYDIYTTTGAEARAREGGQPARGAGALPPIEGRASRVEQVLSDARTGLPEPRPYETTQYRSGLRLEALGQPTVAVGATRYGAVLGGGISAYFSDLLGNHALTTAVEVNSGLNTSFSWKNLAAQAVYVNQAKRWNWGLVGGQVPYLSGAFQQFLATIDGVPSIVDQTIIFRQTERSAAGIVAYPFSRARRVEFQAGATQVSFDRIVETQAFSLSTGQRIADQTEESSFGRSLTLGTTSTALVFDTSTFGATSPVQGQRYRLEATPTFGSINYTSLLADYRRYLMPVSFYTVAARALHYGRYGSGGEDERLFPLFIGYPTLVRGYDPYSFSADECVPSTTSQCPAFDRLTGSRMLVGNLELRFPLLRPFTGPSNRMYGVLPVEVGLFVDGGVAWNRGEKPTFVGGDRRAVSSTGVALRVNLFGFAVGEFDVVRPLQRPRQGWMFQFTLTPGF